jgi:hypothetical protein
MPTRLQLGANGDPAEREADTVANRVAAGMPKVDIGRSAPSIRRRPAAAGASASPTSAVEQVLHSSGAPLTPAVRSEMETRIGHDFSAVRVHTDERAQRSAAELNAEAFTVGHDIAFAQGRYAPESSLGRRLLAHELTHVVQQSNTAPVLQAKVVDDDAHLPCRAVPNRSAADLTARENRAAEFAEQAAVAVRANPVSEATRERLWRWFRLDDNNSVDRCRRIATLGDRLDQLAREIRQTDCTYRCTATGEPEGLCADGNANAATYVGLTRRIDLCSAFWSRTPEEQAETLLHEWAHYLFVLRGVGDAQSGGFDNAACYGAFATEIVTGNAISPDEVNCAPNANPLPARDPAASQQPCPTNVFVNLSAQGGYAYGLPGANHYLTAGAGLDLLFPLTRMHDWELSVGARYLQFAPIDAGARGAYLFGVRTGLQFRHTPWRTGWQAGGYLEGGGIALPTDTSGTRTLPYVGGGVTAGFNLRLGQQTALQIFAEVGGNAGFDTRNSTQFGWFQSGLNAALQFQ